MSNIEVVYRNPTNTGIVTSDGIMFQAWHRISQWHNTRIGEVFFSLGAAKKALEDYVNLIVN